MAPLFHSSLTPYLIEPEWFTLEAKEQGMRNRIDMETATLKVHLRRWWELTHRRWLGPNSPKSWTPMRSFEGFHSPGQSHCPEPAPPHPAGFTGTSRSPLPGVPVKKTWLPHHAQLCLKKALPSRTRTSSTQIKCHQIKERWSEYSHPQLQTAPTAALIEHNDCLASCSADSSCTSKKQLTAAEHGDVKPKTGNVR